MRSWFDRGCSSADEGGCNDDDGTWEEVQWWPAFNQTQAIAKGIAEYERQMKNNPNGMSPEIDISGLKKAPPKIARMKYRSRNRAGAVEMMDTVFEITGTTAVQAKSIQGYWIFDTDEGRDAVGGPRHSRNTR